MAKSIDIDKYKDTVTQEEYSFLDNDETLTEIEANVPIRIRQGAKHRLVWDETTQSYIDIDADAKSARNIDVDQLAEIKSHNNNGRAYGYSPYGESLYGQPGLVHIVDGMEVSVQIRGEKALNIIGVYSILRKYDGTEATIEDIQSYYTDRYMRLGCYDGPALPLEIENR